jgi:hypothetical protein
MRRHDPRTPIAFPPGLIRGPLNTAIAVLACMACAATARAAPEPPMCAKEISVATSKMNGLPASIGTRVDRGIKNAAALARFHRTDGALSKLHAVVALLDGPRGERLPDRARTELTTSLKALGSCLAVTEAAPLAMVTIRAFVEDGTPDGGSRTPAGEGVYLDVAGVRIGRTGPDGTLHANVPSGTIRISATEYPSSIGHELVTLSPGESQTVSVVMADGKEPSEESDLLLEEAPDGILPAHPATLSMAFVQDDSPVTIERIEAIDVSDVQGDAGENLERFFRVNDGVMHATDAAAVYERIAGHSRIGRPLSLAASAIDTEGRSHYGAFRFQIGRFTLAVRLNAPPSNPVLPVSNIPVRVSVIGSDIAMHRIADADGRFEIESLPDATVEFDAHTTAAGVHYYGQATMTMCADRSVTLVMANVRDLVAGTPRLIVDPGTPACPPVPRR